MGWPHRARRLWQLPVHVAAGSPLLPPRPMPEPATEVLLPYDPHVLDKRAASIRAGPTFVRPPPMIPQQLIVCNSPTVPPQPTSDTSTTSVHFPALGWCWVRCGWGGGGGGVGKDDCDGGGWYRPRPRALPAVSAAGRFIPLPSLHGFPLPRPLPSKTPTRPLAVCFPLLLPFPWPLPLPCQCPTALLLAFAFAFGFALALAL
jgi:hypothetical protein